MCTMLYFMHLILIVFRDTCRYSKINVNFDLFRVSHAMCAQTTSCQ